MTAALTFATFFVIVGIGQMFVITLGPGNVDLSIPATMTLAGSVAMKIMDTQDSMILVGLLAALACGLGVGIFNYALILVLRIPPIIATLSSSFVDPVGGDRLWPRACASSRRRCSPSSPPCRSPACRCSPSASPCSRR